MGTTVKFSLLLHSFVWNVDMEEDKDLVSKYFLSQFIKKTAPLCEMEIHIHVRAHTCIFLQNTHSHDK